MKKFPFMVFPQVTAIYIAFNFNAFYSDLLFRQRPDIIETVYPFNMKTLAW
ncbi:hypothetical protein [Mucilaginibacter pallidiroseus]|uniref:hypothetical protein n=1 Tax=Mucilaginibacter pallidiroseus TaxID=2599295 RepID=UPI001645B2FF|nr:hypothetical protein [Mucilaginibacter pallidiroseus]